MTTARWDALAQGQGCWMDTPRPDAPDHWDLVETLSISSLYLPQSQPYRGQCVLVFDRRHATRIDELSRDEWMAFAADLYAAERAIVSVVRPDHVNLELLGNVVPHLHWHVVPRFRSDSRWGMPIWTTPLSEMPDVRLEASDRQTLLAGLGAALGRNASA
jgi:diadenosine tetraphosphate (Ap4A) HIT family hydrolase